MLSGAVTMLQYNKTIWQVLDIIIKLKLIGFGAWSSDVTVPPKQKKLMIHTCRVLRHDDPPIQTRRLKVKE